MQSFIRRYLTPKTMEQSLGVGYLLMAASMIPRPFMAGIENLTIYYGVTPIAPRVVGVMLALFALVLILKKRCGRRLFAALFLPIPIYTICLGWYAWDRLGVGCAGTFAFAGLWLCLVWIYRRLDSEREAERA